MKKKDTVFLFSAVCFIAVFLLFLLLPSKAAEGVNKGLTLCMTRIIPSLFPFTVLSSFFSLMDFPTRTGRFFSPLMRVFGLSGEYGGILAAGLLAGFPTGADMSAHFYISGQGDKKSASLISSFTNSPSPGFVFAVAGGLFDTPYAGALLYVSVSAAAIVSGIILSRIIGAKPKLSQYKAEKESLSPLTAFSGAIRRGTATMAVICSYIILFSVFVNFTRFGLTSAGISVPPVLTAVICGFFELTSGIEAAGATALSQQALFALVAVLLAFSGICANLQSLSCITAGGLSVKICLSGKLIQLSLTLLWAIPLFIASGT